MKILISSYKISIFAFTKMVLEQRNLEIKWVEEFCKLILLFSFNFGPFLTKNNPFEKKMKFYEHNFNDGTTHTLNLVQFFYVIFEKFLAPREKLFMAFCTKKSTEKWQLVSRTCFQVNIHSFLKVLFFEARKLTNNLHDFWICLQRLGWNFKPKL